VCWMPIQITESPSEIQVEDSGILINKIRVRCPRFSESNFYLQIYGGVTCHLHKIFKRSIHPCYENIR
jgi:hypothetical protein